MKCEYCGKKYEPTINIDSRFCCRNCRNSWHNEVSRIKRLEKRATKAIIDLRSIAFGESSNTYPAYNALKVVGYTLEDNVPNVTMYCKSCGQLVFHNEMDSNCQFCGSKDWGYKIIADLRPKKKGDI